MVIVVCNCVHLVPYNRPKTDAKELNNVIRQPYYVDFIDWLSYQSWILLMYDFIHLAECSILRS